MICDLAANTMLDLKSIPAGNIKGVASSSDGSRIVTVTEDGRARLWDVGTETCIYEIEVGPPRPHRRGAGGTV